MHKHIRILYFSVNIYDNCNVPGERGSEGTLSSLGSEPALARDLWLPALPPDPTLLTLPALPILISCSSTSLAWFRAVFMLPVQSGPVDGTCTRTEHIAKSRRQAGAGPSKSTRLHLFVTENRKYQGVKEFHMLARIGCYCHRISQSFDLPTANMKPHHCISQSFDLPIATASLCYHVSQSFGLLTTTASPHQSLDLPTATASLHQSVIWLVHCHCVTALPRHCITTLSCQSFYLPTATTLLHHLISHLTCPLPLCHHVSQSFDLATATASLSHWTCPLPLHPHITALPHKSVIWLAHCHHITTLPCQRITI